jgi:MuDR family transposase
MDSHGYFTNLIENNIIDELLDNSDDESKDLVSNEELLSEEELPHEQEFTGEESGEFLSNSMSFVTDKSWIETYQVVDTDHKSQFVKYGPVKPNGDWKGLIFIDKKALSRALQEWHITHFVQMKVKKSDQNWYTCVCINRNCRWRLHAHKPKGANYFLVSQYNGSHDCVIPIGHRMHRNCTSDLICEKILPLMRASLSMSLKEIRLKIKDELKTDISYQLAWKAHSKALQIIYGSWEQSFSDLPIYLSMLQNTNPETTWTMSPTWPISGVQKFERVFWAFGPSIEGWKYCRPVVSIDGTHLYGKYEDMH